MGTSHIRERPGNWLTNWPSSSVMLLQSITIRDNGSCDAEAGMPPLLFTQVMLVSVPRTSTPAGVPTERHH